MRKLLVVLLLVVPSSLFAWGNTGHRMVARIAEEGLSEEAQAGVRELIGNQSLADIATTADAIRNSRPETKEWHFADVPREAAAYDPSRDCRNDDCVVARIEAFQRTLADTSRSKAERKEALMFLTHFVGDLHQPLHCANGTLPDGRSDRGGNEIPVKLPGQSKSLKLHGVWDSTIIQREGLSEDDLDLHLNDDVLADMDEDEAVSGSVEDWANDAHELANDRAYAFPNNRRLTAQYLKNATRAVDRQLVLGGLRLRKLINDAFATQ